MIPESLIPVRFHISSAEQNTGKAENNADLTQGKITLEIIAEYNDKINKAGNEIWLNFITCEKAAPLFYDFQAE
ncbi:hypothetical protein MUU48_02840 [Scandinavium sp. H11S7]|uniref:hypothetical protein n=1 Tax=Scandinavium hiltneri TaxID=2926519 RepID=UPI0021659C58|nr:hypothetical protein [Scandinavium hiltneri]MCS2155880.1 hypothetical protein [Scandinavium hiltneri]